VCACVCFRIIKTVIIEKQNLVPKLGHGRFRRTTANNIIIIINTKTFKHVMDERSLPYTL